MRSGVASFHMGHYAEAKNCFQEGLKEPFTDAAALRQWVHWCDEKMERLKRIQQQQQQQKAEEADSNEAADEAAASLEAASITTAASSSSSTSSSGSSSAAPLPAAWPRLEGVASMDVSPPWSPPP